MDTPEGDLRDRVAESLEKSRERQEAASELSKGTEQEHVLCESVCSEAFQVENLWMKSLSL